MTSATNLAYKNINIFSDEFKSANCDFISAEGIQIAMHQQMSLLAHYKT